MLSAHQQNEGITSRKNGDDSTTATTTEEVSATGTGSHVARSCSGGSPSASMARGGKHANIWKTEHGLFFAHSSVTEWLAAENIEVEIITLKKVDSHFCEETFPSPIRYCKKSCIFTL